MNNIAFEKLMSINPKLKNMPTSEVCLRDMIYQYYLKIFTEEETADYLTKEYIQKLWEQVGSRHA